MFLRTFCFFLAVATTAYAVSDPGCTLDCNADADCLFYDSNDEDRYADHPTMDGERFDWHKETDINGMYCDCPKGLTGVKCETPFEECDDGVHKCYNGGLCVPELAGFFGENELFCNCEAAFHGNNHYVGKYCEQVASDYCDDEGLLFCLNGGTCNKLFPAEGEPCNCDDAYFGEHCEYKRKSVPKCTLDCENEGYCVLGEKTEEKKGDNDYLVWNPETVDHMHCVCRDGFDGELCQIERTPCGDDAYCFHRGECVERKVNGEIVHHCDCSTASTDETDYAGRFCQYEATSYCTKNAGINGHLFCVNDGQCQENAHKGCVCDEPYAGFSCEFVKEEFTKSEPNSTTSVVPADSAAVQTCDLKCENEGICRHGVKGAGFVGDLDVHSSHLNGEGEEDLMHCVCPEGFAGLYCEETVNVCGDGEHLCLHGGKCIKNDEDEHACDCSETDGEHSETGFYGGDSCEHPVNDLCTTEEPGPGQKLLFCVNGGKCRDYVPLGGGFPGCDCPYNFTGPHCELSRDAPEEPSWSDEQVAAATDDSASGIEVALFTLCTLAILAVVAFFGAVYWQRRRAMRRGGLSDNLRWASEYQDRPGEELNLAPKRRESTTPRGGYEDYPAEAHSSSTDPFATHLAPKSPDVEEPEPQVYIGPPRDEDGHELHNVEIM